MLTYDMDQRGEESLYAYLYDCMRADIENGSIAAGEKLPSKRKLADHLGVSIVTVEGAYRQLIAEGYVESRARRGYFAAHISSSNTRALTKEGGVAPAGTFMSDAFERKGEEEPALFALIRIRFVERPASRKPFPVSFVVKGATRHAYAGARICARWRERPLGVYGASR